MNIYEGSENYIFVSYAHADSDRVMPILEALDKEGFRIWYDSGIEAGSEWPAYIAEHVKACHRMIFFVSKTSVNSKNCRREVNLADSQNKEILVVYLESTELRFGLDLQLLTNQAVNRNKFDSDSSFVEALKRANILKECQKPSNTVIAQSDSGATTAYTADELKSMTDRADEYYDKKDYAQAIYWYRKAAEQGYAQAQTKLGLSYGAGWGVDKDYTQAVYWVRKAAVQGYPGAQYALGLFYFKGIGVDIDYFQMEYWCRKAEEQGFDPTQHILG